MLGVWEKLGKGCVGGMVAWLVCDWMWILIWVWDGFFLVGVVFGFGSGVDPLVGRQLQDLEIFIFLIPCSFRLNNLHAMTFQSQAPPNSCWISRPKLVNPKPLQQQGPKVIAFSKGNGSRCSFLLHRQFSGFSFHHQS